jgi:hypothetical protein
VNESIVVNSANVFGRECFPLALAPMEQFMIWSETLSFPKTFRVVQTFVGTLCQETLRKAFSNAIVRHPLLWASTEVSRGQLRWTIPKERSFEFRSNVGGYDQTPYPPSIDLTCQNGVRFWYHCEEGHSELVSEYHHACCDGLGAQQFLQDWFLAYHQISSGIDPSDVRLPKLTVDHLTNRSAFVRGTRQDTETLSFFQKAVLAYRFHCQPPRWLELEPDATAATTKTIYSRWTIAGEMLKQTDEVLQSHNLTLHEFSMAVMLQTLAETFSQKSKSQRSRLRVMFPTSHRSHQDRRAGAINRIGFAFVSSRSDDCHTMEASLGVACRQLQGIQKYELGLDFVDQLTILTQRPWLAKRVLKWQRPWATAICTNLGHYGHRLQKLFEWSSPGFRIGNLIMTSVSGVPPLQPYTHWGIGLSRHFDQISVLFRSVLSDENSKSLQSLFEENWKKSTATLLGSDQR